MKKRILIISDSFKGSLSSIAVGNAIKKGILKAQADYQVDVQCVSDGGEGFLESLNQNPDFEIFSLEENKDLLLRNSVFQYGILKDTVYIESAQTCGLDLLKPEERNPANTSSYGLGLGISRLIEKGYSQFTVGLGGTATNDGGAGLLSGLGFTFLDQNNQAFIPNGGNLIDIRSITPTDLDLSNISFTLASDVINILLGTSGATYTFAKQKGATDLISLEKGMKHYASLFQNKHSNQASSGAAGGIGFSLMNIAPTEVKSGAAILYKSLGLNESLPNYDLIISGEGKIDQQTDQGKWVDFISQQCLRHNKDLLLFCGMSATKTYKNSPVLSLMDIAKSPDESQRNAAVLLEDLAFLYFSDLEPQT